MALTKKERDALNAADDPDGIRRGDSGFYGIGEKTLDHLIELGLMETFPQAVAGYPLFRTTPAGKAALREPRPPKVKSSFKLKMQKPLVRVADLSIAKPRKR